MELGTAGGVAEMLQRIVDAKDRPTLIRFFKDFILEHMAKRVGWYLFRQIRRNFQKIFTYTVLQSPLYGVGYG